MSVTIERLRELFSYDALTGIFTRRIASGRHGRNRAGEVAGCIDKATGYVKISVDGKKYQAHRLAWFYVHGVWPDPECDHKDTIRSHNWIDNLRPATRGQNMQNLKRAHRDSRSGYLGVTWSESEQKWIAQIAVDGRNIIIGRFDDPAVAHEAYKAKKVRLHHFQTISEELCAA